MSKGYIDREEVILTVKHAWAKGLEPTQYIEQIPAADVAPAGVANIYGRAGHVRTYTLGDTV